MKLSYSSLIVETEGYQMKTENEMAVVCLHASLTSIVCGRYLDNNSLTGTLDILNMFSLGLLQDKNSAGNSTKLGIMSLSNNSIEHVISSLSIIANTTTVFM